MADAVELYAVGPDVDAVTVLRQNCIHRPAGRDPGRGDCPPTAEIRIRTRPHRGGSDDGGFGHPVHVLARPGLHGVEKRILEADEGDSAVVG